MAMTLYVLDIRGKYWEIDEVTDIAFDHTIVWQDGVGYRDDGPIYIATVSGATGCGIPLAGTSTVGGGYAGAAKVYSGAVAAPATMDATVSAVFLPDAVAHYAPRPLVVARSIINFTVSTQTFATQKIFWFADQVSGIFTTSPVTQ